MHHDIGVCSIGHGELIVVLLVRHEREHAVQRRRACGMDEKEQSSVSLPHRGDPEVSDWTAPG
jgi:hypothetical protein